MVCNGIDNTKGLEILKGKRLGLITNPTGVNRRLCHSADILREQFKLVALYGPEHGVRGDRQDGVNIDSTGDTENGIPIFSLFGKTPRLTDAMLDGVDMVVYDMQDVGARFYTYIDTMAHAMEECTARDIPFTVLDRVNPLGCTQCEGIAIRPEYDSVVGAFGLVARYAMTPGRLARYLQKRIAPACRLNVVPCLDYTPDMLFPETRLPWVSPSPNIPTFETALAYIGTCIFEGTNISEGRGTTHPFELIGAPFLDAPSLAKVLNSYNLPGVLFRAAHFMPAFRKYANQLCHGIQIHITDPRAFRPYTTGLLIHQEIARQTTLLEYKLPHFDRIAGDDTLRTHDTDVTPLIQRALQESEDFQKSLKLKA